MHGIIDRHFLDKVNSETEIWFIPWIWEEVWIPKEIIIPFALMLAHFRNIRKLDWGTHIDSNRLGHYITNEGDRILVISEKER